MFNYVVFSIAIIIISSMFAHLLVRLFKAPYNAVWSSVVIGLCNFMLLAALMMVTNNFSTLLFCVVVVIGMIIFTVITGKVTQTSYKTSRNIVALLILIDFLIFIAANYII